MMIVGAVTYVSHMCRNITILRGLEPPATSDEITAAATQFVRKVTGVAKGNETTAALMRNAEAEIAGVVARLLADLPPRRQEPTVVPPLRRPQVRARLGLEPFQG
jgi:hypothetical protein